MKHNGWARFEGAFVPALAVASVIAFVFLLDAMVGLEGAQLPRPVFGKLVRDDYSETMLLKEAEPIVEAILWWLCLSVILWTVSLATLGLCWLQVHRAHRQAVGLGFVAKLLFLAALAAAVVTLFYFAGVRGTPLMSFAHLVDNLGIVSSGFVRLASFNTALAFVVGVILVLSMSLLLLPGAHADHPMQQMRAITRTMYAGAIFLLVWISAATGMYRLSALLLVPDARDAMLKLAPTIGLMGGLFLSLLLAAAYASACVWLQRSFERFRSARDTAGAAKDAASPAAFLVAHWPKVFAILLPLLPGAAESVLQAMARAP